MPHDKPGRIAHDVVTASSFCQADPGIWLKQMESSFYELEYGLIKANKLERQKTVTANWYTTKCLPEILQEVNVKGLMLHHDNVPSHTAGLTVEFLKQKQIKVIEHPPYSLDLAMCDFWLLLL
ncbi:histone-lysine N-methyltransferase SETMAR [Trichonephila clavipes]|nr:histone-lysine N-methyltransferase SETMAR [Trichonephila clavipes]